MSATPRLQSARLLLEPLDAAHADECYGAFADASLWELMDGSRPASPAELRATFGRLAAGCPRPAERWLNWIARERAHGTPVGWHQATVVGEHADIAWVTFAAHQRHGYAREGATAVFDWLASIGVREVVAQSDLRNAGSRATALALGFEPDPETIVADLHGEATVDQVYRLRWHATG
jgi:RimJ/RimL family protein N-acetyltransferase